MRSERWSGRSRIQRARDIVDAIEALTAFADGLDRDSFCGDRKTQSAVERELLTVSEACSKLLEFDEDEPDDRRLESRFPSIPWRAIRGIGNIIRHEYGRVDPATIWATIDGSDLRDLKGALEEAFPEAFS